jgi:ArsR family transcriptional regulator
VAAQAADFLVQAISVSRRSHSMATPELLSPPPSPADPEKLSLLVAALSTEAKPGAIGYRNGVTIDSVLSQRPDLLSSTFGGTDVDIAVVAKILSGLGHAVRLEVLRVLLSRGLTGLPAGRIAVQLKLAPSSLSFHLSQMVYDQILIQRRSGRQIIYTANNSTIAALCAFLEREMVQIDPIVLPVDKTSDIDGK